MIHFDSDGIFANWEEYVNRVHFPDITIDSLNQMESRVRKAAMRDVYMRDPDLFYKLKPIAGAEQLLEFVESARLPWKILTAGSSDHFDIEHVKLCKRLWFATHHSVPSDKIVVVMDSGDKQKYAGHGKILVDDYAKNCNQWADAGGVAIQTTSNQPNIPSIISLLTKFAAVDFKVPAGVHIV